MGDGLNQTAAENRHPTFRQALRFWLKLGFISFGGPTGQIAIMHAELVERKRWISEARFIHALNYCMLLPGPEAQQLATYIGWLLHRTWGGIIAGVLFVLPSMFILWGLSFIYAAYGSVPTVEAIFHGLKAAVLAIVAHAVIRIGRKVLKNWVMWTIAAAAFVAIYFLKAPFPAIIAGAGMIGFIGGVAAPRWFRVLKSHGSKGGDAGHANNQRAVLHDDQEIAAHHRPTLGRSLRVLVVCLMLWAAPILLAGGMLGWRSALAQEGIFFSKAAMVTFGGAYAVLPYVAQQAVEKHEWLSKAEMMDGLGLAETTPGPLIIVVQFVGFMGGWNHPIEWDDGTRASPLLSATLGALMATWTTFVPCFLWIFLGAPYVEGLRENVRLTSALATITAAVVGVVLNLAVWFGLHAIFPGDAVTLENVNWFVVVVAAATFLGLLRWNWGVVGVVLGCAAAGLLHGAVTGAL
ncbi:MAG: chromate efflux transporter [Phycisphaeraceae bacterium]|nr:MAG: chromate efflux transporter [Phycisphaeraceae bacterium]